MCIRDRLNRASTALTGMSPILFTNMAFLIYIALAFLIPSTSGLASLSAVSYTHLDVYKRQV